MIPTWFLDFDPVLSTRRGENRYGWIIIRVRLFVNKFVKWQIPDYPSGVWVIAGTAPVTQCRFAYDAKIGKT